MGLLSSSPIHQFTKTKQSRSPIFVETLFVVGSQPSHSLARSCTFSIQWISFGFIDVVTGMFVVGTGYKPQVVFFAVEFVGSCPLCHAVDLQTLVSDAGTLVLCIPVAKVLLCSKLQLQEGTYEQFFNTALSPIGNRHSHNNPRAIRALSQEHSTTTDFPATLSIPTRTCA